VALEEQQQMADENKVVEKKEPSTLSKSLNIGMDSVPSMGQTKEGREYAATAKPLMENLAKSTADVEMAKMDVEAKKIGAQAQASKEFGDTTRKLYQEAENKELEYPRPEFHPTKENAESLGQLFSMVATFGLLVGNSGKLASQNALDAMTGMLKGWQTGRKDLYEREVREFDKEYKRIQDIRTDIQNKLQKAIQLASTDKETSNLLKQEVIALFGTNSVGGKLMAQGKDKAAFDLLTNTTNIDEKVKDREQRAQQHLQSLQMQRDRMAQKEGSSGKGQGLNQRFAFNISEAAQQAGQDLLNITQMPKGTVLGTFSDMTGLGGDSMSKALRNTFTRKITDVEARQFQQLVSGFENNMSRALGGGYANSGAKGAVEAYKQQVARAGDDPIAMATFLARSKQELEILNKQFKVHPGANAGEIQQLDEMMSLINGAVPFNVADVLKASGKGKETVSSATQQMVLPKIPTLQEFLVKAKESNPNSSDEDLTNYYNKKYGGQ
jgi:hypothetical protein